MLTEKGVTDTAQLAVLIITIFSGFLDYLLFLLCSNLQKRKKILYLSCVKVEILNVRTIEEKIRPNKIKSCDYTFASNGPTDLPWPCDYIYQNPHPLVLHGAFGNLTLLLP